jgi:hypothetical protein
MGVQLSTRSSLGVFFDGEEVDGFTVYGYWPRLQIVPSSLEIDHLGDRQVKFPRLAGNNWMVGVWDIKIQTWPAANLWSGLIQRALRHVLRSESLVAWCAVEGTFVDPPNLFDLQYMSSGVWAACTADGLQFGPPGLDEPFELLTDEQLLKLQRIMVQPVKISK